MMLMMLPMFVRMITSVTTATTTATATAMASNFDRYHVRICSLLATPTMSSSTAAVV